MVCAMFTSCGDDEPELADYTYETPVDTPEYRSKVSGTYEGTIIKSEEHSYHEYSSWPSYKYTELDTIGKCDVVFNNDGMLSINEFPVEMWSNLLGDNEPYKDILRKCTEKKKIEEPYKLMLITEIYHHEKSEIIERSIEKSRETMYINADNKDKVELTYDILSESLKRDYNYINLGMPMSYVHDGICLRLIKCNAADKDEHYCYNSKNGDNTILFIYIDYKYDKDF